MESDTIIDSLSSECVTEIETTTTVDGALEEDHQQPHHGDSYYEQENNDKHEYVETTSGEHDNHEERNIGSDGDEEEEQEDDNDNVVEDNNDDDEEEEEDDDDEEKPLQIVGFDSEDGDANEDIGGDNNVEENIKMSEVILENQQQPEGARGLKRKILSEDDDEEEFTSEDDEEFAGFEENVIEEESQRNIKRFASSTSYMEFETPINPQTTTTTNNNTTAATNNSSNSNHNVPKSPAFVVKKGGGPRTIPLTDPIYQRPFEHGWKRELVLRAIPEASKEKGEVYYIAPNGKRLRTRHEIYLNLAQSEHANLTLDNFTFSKEPLGLNSDMEIIRSAKLLTNTAKKSELEISNITHSKRIPKPKVPKGASPPPPPLSASTGTSSSNLLNRSSTNKLAVAALRSVTTPTSMDTAVPSSSDRKSSKSKRKSCTIQCVMAMGTIPSLQCKSCSWLYHHECYGVENNSPESFHYTCEVCKLEQLEALNHQKLNPNYPQQSPFENVATATTIGNTSRVCTSPPVSLQTPPPPPQSSSQSIPPPPLPTTSNTNQIILNTNTKCENVVDSLTTWHHYTTNIQSSNQNVFNTSDIPPQTIASINGRKFIVVPKTNVLSVSPPRDSSTATSLKTTDNFNNYGFNKFSVTRRRNSCQWAAAAGTNEEMVEQNFSNDTSAAAAITSPTSGTAHNDSNSLSRKKSGSRTPKSSSGTELDGTSANNVNKLTRTGSSNSGSGEVGTATNFTKHFFANLSVGYDVLLHTFQYLKVQELLRAGCVCRLWNQAANNAILWRTVRMKNSQVNDWHGFARTLIKNGTKHLDLRKMLSPKNNPEETWQKFSQSIGKIKNLETIDLCKCSVHVVENLFETNHNLRVLNAVTLKDDTLNLKNLSNLNLLTELRLKSTLGLIITDLSPLKNLAAIKHLSLTSIKELGNQNLNVLGELRHLESLELGECSEFSTNFVSTVLAKLNTLQRLRLEKGQETCCTFDILTGISQMVNLIQLELINFDIKAEFDEYLAKCTNIKKLLLIPTYVSQSATTNQTVLNAVMKLTDSLTNFTWAVTSELVRVTELYVDNCESNRRNKKALSDCIPILKPVPGILDTTQIMSKRAKSDVPQVEILPLTSVEKILSTALPAAKVNMIIIAFHATWRQNLVEN